ncbi:MAG TPA: DNA gyrase C-terminal beta-propeller domain-containing protein, partial [Methanomassiliicoccaceae archaeon]|nr:DNA gyrase C-terminal beta-propeller domain-containing protein [Methanomassiliicoccaceae archaeon]
KTSLVSDYRKTHRGSKGVITIRTNERNGGVVSVRTIGDDDQLLITTQQGKVIRVAAGEIRTMGRSTQGVKIMDLAEGDKITAVARLVGANEEEQIAKIEVHESELVVENLTEADDE